MLAHQSLARKINELGALRSIDRPNSTTTANRCSYTAVASIAPFFHLNRIFFRSNDQVDDADATLFSRTCHSLKVCWYFICFVKLIRFIFLKSFIRGVLRQHLHFKVDCFVFMGYSILLFSWFIKLKWRLK